MPTSRKTILAAFYARLLPLAPHRWRQFKLSNDKAFAEKLHDLVGLYVSPPAHAVVLSIDETSQIHALDRTQPGLPLKKPDPKSRCPAHADSSAQGRLDLSGRGRHRS